MLRVLALVLALLPLPVAAQEDGQGSAILTIVPDRLFEETRAGQAMQARVEEATRDLIAENRRIEQQLEAEERALTEQRDTMTPAQFRPLADAFGQKAERTRTEQDAKARQITRLQEDYRKAFFQAAIPLLAKLMAEEDAVAILDHSSVFLSFDMIDVTDRAIARVDAELGDGSQLLEADDAP